MEPSGKGRATQQGLCLGDFVGLILSPVGSVRQDGEVHFSLVPQFTDRVP